MNARRPVVTVVGSFMMDLVVRTKRRPAPGETVIGEEFGIFPGGKGVNQAVTAARLGAEVYMVGRVGCDQFGDQFLALLEGEGIHTEWIVRDEEAGTGIGNPVLDGTGQNSIVVVPRANLRVSAGDIERAKGAIAQSDVVLLQLEISAEGNRRAAELARELGKPVILNPAPAPDGGLDPALLELVTVLTPNESELRALTGVAPVDDLAASRAAEQLLKTGIDMVVLTMGERGAALYRAGWPALQVDAHQVPVVDTTGAGDAFNGALAVGMALGLRLPDLLTLANTAGAIAVTRLGAVPSMPGAEQVRAFWQQRGLVDLLPR